MTLLRSAAAAAILFGGLSIGSAPALADGLAMGTGASDPAGGRGVGRAGRNGMIDTLRIGRPGRNKPESSSIDTYRIRRDRGDRPRRRGRIQELGLIGGDWSDGGWGYEHNRTAEGNGYFGHGSSDGGRYDYDRGYPYDHYDDGGTGERSYARPTRCRTEWVPDGHGEEVPVNICRG